MADTGNIAKALAAAQAEMRNPAFDSSNPHFRSRFASLASVRNACVPVLAAHGIALTQSLSTTEDGSISCLTQLWHESGERMDFGPLVIKATKPDAQGQGSASTYARRYSMQAACGVVGDDDDDANAASTPSGDWKADPRGDLGAKNIPTKDVNRWASRLTDAQDNATALAEIWGEVKESHDLAVAVWAALPKAMKDRIRDATKEVA